MASLTTTAHALITDNLANVRAKLATACRDAGRGLGEVELVCVSKNFDADAIAVALDNGQRVFGENRVQEAREKWPELRNRYCDVQLHLIGPLQSNKTHDAVELFDVIEIRRST